MVRTKEKEKGGLGTKYCLTNKDMLPKKNWEKEKIGEKQKNHPFSPPTPPNKICIFKRDFFLPFFSHRGKHFSSLRVRWEKEGGGGDVCKLFVSKKGKGGLPKKKGGKCVFVRSACFCPRFPPTLGRSGAPQHHLFSRLLFGVGWQNKCRLSHI